MPFIPMLIEAGAVGLCFALIIVLFFIVKLFVNALMKFADVMSGLSSSVDRLSERIERMDNRRFEDMRDWKKENATGS